MKKGEKMIGAAAIVIELAVVNVLIDDDEHHHGRHVKCGLETQKLRCDEVYFHNQQ